MLDLSMYEKTFIERGFNMDTTITQGNQNVPETSTTANSGEKVLTAFDKWVTGPVAKTVKKHIKPSDFNQNKLNIEVKVNGYNEGTFQIIVDKTKPDKHEQIAVNPYDYKDYDVHLEGDTSTILELLKKHTVLNEEIYNKTIIAKAKKDADDKQKSALINQLSYSLSPGDFYSWAKNNLYTNSNFMLLVLSIACILCATFTLIITNNVDNQYTQLATGVLFAIGLMAFPLLSYSVKEKFVHMLVNFLFVFLIFCFAFYLFYSLYEKSGSDLTSLNGKGFALSIFSLFIMCLTICYVIFAAIYKFWIFFNSLFTKLFIFKKAEDSENLKLQIKSEFFLKLAAIISTLITILATVVPLVSAIVEIIKG